MSTKPILPGENGTHVRDGSLVKQKREKWEKERAEADTWFPFGRDSTRSSLRSKPSTPAQQSDAQQSTPSTSSQSPHNVNLQITQHVIHSSAGGTSFPAYSLYTPSPIYSQSPIPPLPYTQPFTQPPPVGYLTPTSQPNPYAYLAGSNTPSLSPAWPVQNPSQMAAFQCATGSVSNPSGGAYPINSMPLVPAQQPFPQMAYTAMNAVAAFPLPAQQLADGQSGSYRTVIAITPMDESSGLSTPKSESKTDRDHDKSANAEELQHQIEERRRVEEELAEKERRELEEIQRAQEEQERRRKQEDEEAAERRRHIQEQLETHEKTYLNSMERTRMETEVFKKALLHKHRLIDANGDFETISKILCTTNTELIQRVMKNLVDFERQKRLEDAKRSHTSPGVADCSHTHGGSGGTSGGSGALHTSRSEPASSSHGRPPAVPQRRLNGKCSVDTEQTPLTRAGPGRSSLRAPPVQRKPLTLARRSGSADRSNTTAPTALQYSANSANSSQSARPTPPQPKPRNRVNLQAKRESPPNTLSHHHAMISCSATSMDSSKTTVIGDSPFAEHLPRIDTNSHHSNETNAASDDSQADDEREVDANVNTQRRSRGPKPPVPPKPTSIIVNRSFQEETNAKGPQQQSAFDEEAFKQYFVYRQTPLENLKQYEAMVSKFSPILRTASTMKNSASGVLHAETVRYLSGLDNVEVQSQSRGTASSFGRATTQQIGLFEPVKTRNKMRQESANVSVSERPHQQSGGASGSMGASTDVTPSDSSPVSSSPPLSSGCKSSSSIENHGMDFLDANERTPRGKENSKQECKFQSDASGSSENPCPKSRNPFTGISSHRFNTQRSASARRDLSERPPASPFAQKLAENGSRRNINENPEILRRNLQSPTMRHLQESLGNLSTAGDSPPCQSGGSADTSENHSRPITPKPFNCQSMQYRSLNLKTNFKTPTESQQRILEQLENVRARLKNRQMQIEETLSNQQRFANPRTSENVSKNKE